MSSLDAPVASSSTPQVSTAMDVTPSSAPVDDNSKGDRALTEFMLMLDEYEPLIPNEVTEYYLQKVGFQTEDVRLKRLLSLAAQKFVSDIASDAFQHARLRTNASTGGRPKATREGQSNPAKDKTKTVLTPDDLSSALAEYGMNSKKPEYYL